MDKWKLKIYVIIAIIIEIVIGWYIDINIFKLFILIFVTIIIYKILLRYLNDKIEQDNHDALRKIANEFERSNEIKNNNINDK